MSPLFSYFWPAFCLGMLAGVVASAVAYRHLDRRVPALSCGFAAALILAALWHGPLGGAERLERRVEREVQSTLTYYEMTQVTAHLHHGPLTRRVILSGPADDFQRGELARMMEALPGVASARWAPDGGGLPLIVEGCAVALLGFLLGLVLAYLVELRRRYNAEWSW